MTRQQIDIFRSMSPAQKLDLAGQFHDAARQLKARGLRALHPAWPEAKVAEHVRRIFLYAAD